MWHKLSLLYRRSYFHNIIVQKEKANQHRKRESNQDKNERRERYCDERKVVEWGTDGC